MADNKLKGDLGEKKAIKYLMKKGYKILETNYRIRKAEIDIIAAKGSVVAFVEVKYRESDAMGRPAEAVNAIKQQKIIMAARHFIMIDGESHDYRFDVCEVTPEGINYIEDAFWA